MHNKKNKKKNKIFKARMGEIMLNRAAYYFYIEKYKSNKILKTKLLSKSNILKYMLIFLLKKKYLVLLDKIKKMYYFSRIV